MNTESQNIEFKQTWRDEYLKWICGFANAQGGTIYIGIDDDGNVKGVDKIHELSETIPNKIATHLGIVADVNILTKNRLQYLEIKVLPSNIPISLNGVYHYRSGSTKQELKGIALQQFLLRKMGRSWDDIPHETATLKRISRTAIDYFVNHAVRAFRMPTSALTDSTETILENLNLLTDDGKLRNAALLLFAENPQRY
ncbi:MAG: putative DNA binding domain-containing protein, partial [Bacteroidales bacterium]|nr:putative DNA binding domain-containing protein [Bacteroidales bacterium]